MAPKANGIATCCYFRSVEDIHRFAHSPLHREAWDWWNSITATHPHLSIMHELYSAPAKGWENIYVNYHRTGVGTYQNLQMTMLFKTNNCGSEHPKACDHQWNGIPTHR